ncbi:MAG: magnesium transporter [Cyclobacteriaceae bacterium]|jgi:magnesium transporter
MEEHIVSTVTSKELIERLKHLLHSGDHAILKAYLEERNAAEIVHAVSHISREEQLKLLTVLSPSDAAIIIDDIPYVQAVDIMDDLAPAEAASILNEMDSDDRADILSDMDSTSAEQAIDEMPANEAEKIKQLISYDSQTAGGLMITEFLAFDLNMTVGQVVKKLRANVEEYEHYNVQYVYVTEGEKFCGVLQMRALLLSKETTKLSKIVIKGAKTVLDSTGLEDLIDFFDTHDFYGAPVVDLSSRLLGVVQRKHVREEQSEQSNFELLETQGIVGGEELRTMPILLRARRRLSWLSVNILLNIVAASVIAIYQDTLSSVIALAVFLPVISDMSGCSGNQAVAVSLRELSLGVVKPYEILRVLWQEFSVGLINGVVLGILIGIAAWIWQGNIYLGIVAGGALMLNTIVAVSIGGTIPLALKRFGVDPALASGPILTTVTDMLGFFLALTFAGLLLNYLV